MSNKAMTWAIEARVTKSHKLVLMLIADAHNGHTGACFPSQEFLEDATGLADSTILEVLRDLETWGFLTRHTKSLGRGKGSRRDFELHLEVLTPRNLDLYSSGLGRPENTPLDVQPTIPPLKEEPESNRKEPEDAREEIAMAVQDIWSHTPDVSRKRSSRKELEAAIRGLKGKVDLADLRYAVVECVNDPQMVRDGHKFMPAIHRWIGDGRYESFLPKRGDLLTTEKPTTDGDLLDWCFATWAKSKRWNGRGYGFLYEPDDPDANYPDALYAKHGLTKPERV